MHYFYLFISFVYFLGNFGSSIPPPRKRSRMNEAGKDILRSDSVFGRALSVDLIMLYILF